MLHASHRFTVDRPVGEVFTFVANPRNEAKWNVACRAVALRSAEAPQAGVEFQMSLRVMGRDIETRHVIETFEESRRVAFKTLPDSPLRIGATYNFQSARDQATHVQVTVEADLSEYLGIIPERLFEPLFEKSLRDDARRLKSSIEKAEAREGGIVDNTKINIDQIADHIIDMFPKLDQKDEQHLSLSIYRLLARGEPVPLHQLTAESGMSEGDVERLLESWPGIYRDDSGSIIGYWGLAIPKMAHSFVVDGRQLYTWCAWDSLFIPPLLGAMAEVQSTCPVTSSTVRLTVGPDGVHALEPMNSKLSFLNPDPGKVQADIISSFCHHIYFFSSPEAGAEWVAKHPGTFLITVEEALYLGRRKNASQYSDVLTPDVVALRED